MKTCKGFRLPKTGEIFPTEDHGGEVQAYEAACEAASLQNEEEGQLMHWAEPVLE